MKSPWSYEAKMQSSRHRPERQGHQYITLKTYVKKKKEEESSLKYKIWLVKHHSDSVEFAVSHLCSCNMTVLISFCGSSVQVWPISCTLGATTGFLTGLVAAPVWIHWHRKQLTYKLKWGNEGHSHRPPEKRTEKKNQAWVKNDCPSQCVLQIKEMTLRSHLQQ